MPSLVGSEMCIRDRIWARTGARRDGTLVNAHVRLVIDGGAYTSSSAAVIFNASTFAAGPYEVPNALIDGTAVYTNNPPCGAMRGFGAVQVLSLIHISEPTRLGMISYAVFCLKKKKKQKNE